MKRIFVIFVVWNFCVLMFFGLVIFGQDVEEMNSSDKADLVNKTEPRTALEIAKMMVARGDDLNAKNSNGQTFLRTTVRIKSSDTAEVIEYLVKHKVDINEKDHRGDTLLHDATDVSRSLRYLEFIKVLIENGANVNAKNHDGQTPLHKIVQGFPRKDIIKYLVEKGADAHAVDNLGRTPLSMLNIESMDNDLIKLLANKENVNQAVKHGRTILNQAIQNGLPCEIIEFLCKECKADTNKIDGQGKSPLHYAVAAVADGDKNNGLETIKILLKHNANINAKDQQGLTALAMAAGNQYCNNVITLLIKHGADVNCKNEKGTPFLQIILENQTDTDLLKKFINENKINTNTEITKIAPNLLQIAAGQKNGLNKIKLLVQLGFKINDRNNLKQTLLHIAAATQDETEILEYFIENGADVNAKDNLEKTPLAYAVEHVLDSRADLKVVEYLLKQKIEIDAKDNSGATPLMAVLKKEYLANRNYSIERLTKLVQLLIDNKADLNTKDNNQNTPIHYALLLNKANFLKSDTRTMIMTTVVIQRSIIGLDGKENEKYIELIKLLIKNGADINAKNGEGLTPLGLMTTSSHIGKLDLKVLKYLLEQGADCNAKDKDGFTPFQMIIRHNVIMNKSTSTWFFKLLLEYGGETDWSKVKSISPIVWALYQEGDFKEIKYFVEHGADVNALDKAYNKSPLTTAIDKLNKQSTEYCDVVKYLVDNGANLREKILNPIQPGVLYPSHLCNLLCRHPDPDLVKLFVENGADIHFKDSHVGGVLGYAVKYNVPKEVIEYLIKQGTDIDTKDNHDRQAIHYLSKTSSVEILKLLLDHGADINAKTDDNERPILIAADADNIEIMKSMIENGADVNVKDQHGRTPLMLALDNNKQNLDIVKLFIKHGNKAKDTDNSERNALHYAVGNGNIDINVVKFLVTENDIDINAKTSDGRNVLHFVATLLSSSVPEVTKYLIDNGADMNAVNKEGKTPAQIALKYIVLYNSAKNDQLRDDILAIFKLDLLCRLDDERTLLHWAAIEGRERNVVRMLLDAGVPINAKDKFGSTALHLVASNKSSAAERIMQSLLDNGADINATDIYGATPLHDAASSNASLSIFEILLKHNADINAKDIHGLKPINLLREELEPEKAKLLKGKK